MIVYFNLNNGECIKPKSSFPPAYRATFKFMKLIKIEACWNIVNLKSFDQSYIEQLDNDLIKDFNNLKLLQTSLRRLAWKQLFTIRKKKYSYDSSKWIYKEFWKGGKFND